MEARQTDIGRKAERPMLRRSSKARAKPLTAEKDPEHEIELKFAVPERSREALIAALERQPNQTHHLTSHYFDTPDGRLAAAGVSLRLRQVDHDWVQTLKVSAGGDIQERLEDEVAVSRAADQAPLTLDITCHDRSAAGPALKRALKDCNGQALVERYTTAVVRRSCELSEGESRVELAFDQGQVTAGERHAPVCELEFELKAGGAKGLCTLARAWLGPHGLCLSTESKSARGERLVEARDDLPVVKATLPKLDAEMSGPVMLQVIVRSCLDQILPNATAVAAGSRDHEHVHQLRVGLRRLRTAMRELGDLSDLLDPACEGPIAEGFRQLGAYRDRDAVLEALRPELMEAGATGLGWMEAEGEPADPVSAVRDVHFQTALLEVLGFALDGNPGGKGAEGGSALIKQLRKRLKTLHRSVVGDGLRFKKLNETAQHRVRKRLKRLRYVSEFVGGLFDRRAVDTYLDGLRPAQDALGEHNDYVVAREMARKAADEGDPEAAFARKWLDKRQKKSAKASWRVLKAMDEAPLFWK